MRIVMSKMKQILYPVVICLVMLATIAPINVPTSKTVSARAQQPASVKTGAFTDTDSEAMLSRIFPFYKADSWLSTGRNGFDARSFLSKPGLSGKLIVPAQEQGMTSVPFKGFITREGIAREGKVNLVLKIYDQPNGGTKLYEGIHEAEVRLGQYFAMIQVPSETIAKSQTIWLEAAGVEEKELAFEPRLSFATKAPEGVTTNHFNIVALCFTCGGAVWHQVGAIPVTSDPVEFGPACDGALTTRQDRFPFLCQRN
jgi:hypothetical protein